MKAFVDNKYFSKIKFVFHRVKNIVGKGEKACYQHFLFPFFFGSAEVVIAW